MVQVGTIREIHERLLNEGYNISAYRLRLWVKQGVLPAVQVGVKSLISYQNVLKILNPHWNPDERAMA